MSVEPSPEKRTIDRSEKRAPAWLRVGLGTLGVAAPSLAARIAERLFLTPPSPRLLPEHERFLRTAERADLTHDGRRVAVYRWGRGPTVLLLHGWGGRASQLRAFVPALVEAGYTAVAIDAPGHGDSEGPGSSMAEFAGALSAVAAFVQASPARETPSGRAGIVEAVVAHSMGCAATQLAISRGGLSPRGLVFLAPPADAFEFFQRFSRIVAIEGDVKARTKARIERRVGVPFEELNATKLSPKQPTNALVIHDSGDDDVPWSDGERVAQAIPGARFVTTHGLGHRKILHDPKVIAEAVSFLRPIRRAA